MSAKCLTTAHLYIGRSRKKVNNTISHAHFLSSNKIYFKPNTTATCNVGDWVEVMYDFSPGVCSEGGTGVVIAKHEGEMSVCTIIIS
jgi:hypothetical protein